MSSKHTPRPQTCAGCDPGASGPDTDLCDTCRAGQEVIRAFWLWYRGEENSDE